jgi:hypothetical protein
LQPDYRSTESPRYWTSVLLGMIALTYQWLSLNRDRTGPNLGPNQFNPFDISPMMLAALVSAFFVRLA